MHSLANHTGQIRQSHLPVMKMAFSLSLSTYPGNIKYVSTLPFHIHTNPRYKIMYHSQAGQHNLLLDTPVQIKRGIMSFVSASFKYFFQLFIPFIHIYRFLLSPTKQLSYILILQTTTGVQTITGYDDKTGTHKQII